MNDWWNNEEVYRLAIERLKMKSNEVNSEAVLGGEQDGEIA